MVDIGKADRMWFMCVCVSGEVVVGSKAGQEGNQSIKQADTEKAWWTCAQKGLALFIVSIPISTDEKTIDQGFPTPRHVFRLWDANLRSFSQIFSFQIKPVSTGRD